MHLIQIFLPLRDNEGKPFPDTLYHQVRGELTRKFHGLTAYSRAPAEGVWKDNENEIAHDDIVIFEIMFEELNEEWWKQYKISLQEIFRQDEIIIRLQEMRLL